MNIFILNTGRCGSTTFIKACEHITNYSAGHESRVTLIGDQRLAYAENHIEVDNRLSWFLGRLDEKYGDSAFYVHLHRDVQQTAASFAQRENFGILKAYKEGILLEGQENQCINDIALDYINTVETNIRHFLKDKSHKMDFNLETAAEDFKVFWNKIAAQGNLQQALSEWNISYNASA